MNGAICGTPILFSVSGPQIAAPAIAANHAPKHASPNLAETKNAANAR
jgi:hypothetical protein